MASLSNHIHYQKCDLLYIPALLYYAVCLAMTSSFWDTFKGLQKYITDFDDCWLQTLRVKRGMADTREPGAFCKDQATFDGAMRILENRDKIDFTALYAGKVSLETYFLCEKQLIAAAKDHMYVVPPQIRGPKNAEFFHRRINEIYESHHQLFNKFSKQKKPHHPKQNSCQLDEQPQLVPCEGVLKPPLTFFDEPLNLQLLMMEASMMLKKDSQPPDLVFVIGVTAQQKQLINHFLKQFTPKTCVVIISKGLQLSATYCPNFVVLDTEVNEGLWQIFRGVD